MNFNTLIDLLRRRKLLTTHKESTRRRKRLFRRPRVTVEARFEAARFYPTLLFERRLIPALSITALYNT